MHPDVLRALAQARHQDRLGDARFSRHAKTRSHHALRFPRVRQRVGALLIAAGARLTGQRSAELRLLRD